MNILNKIQYIPLLLLFFYITAQHTLLAQSPQQVLHAPTGIAVFVGDTLATATTPLQGYVVHRKELNGDWQRITSTPIRLNVNAADYHAVIDEQEFNKQIERLGFSSADAFFQYLTTSGRADTAAALLLQSRVAELFGLLYIDNDVRSGVTYQYGISTIYNGSETPIKEVGIITAGQPVNFAVLNAPTVRMNNNDAEIILQSSSSPFGVQIERADPTEVFRLIAKILLDSTAADSASVFIDTSAPLGSIVQYRLIAFDYLGNTSSPSAPATLVVINPTLSGFTLQAEYKNNAVQISWVPNAPCAACRFVIIRRAADSSTADYMILDTVSAAESVYEDTDILPNKIYFYTLQYIGYNGKQGDISASVQAYARLLTPPVAPAILRAESVPTGIALRWTPSISPEIDGYIVYRSNSPADSLVQISNNIITDTVYTDTSLTLSAYSMYFYAIAAQNTAGVLGDTTFRVAGQTGRKAELPTPNALGYLLDVTSVLLRWQDEQPYIPALAGYNIYRQRTQDALPIRLNDSLIPPDRLTFRDSSPVVGETVQYFHSVVDIRNNESPLSEGIAVLLQDLPLPRPTGVRAYPQESGVSLRWNVTADSRVNKFILLRSIAGEAYRPIAEIPSNSSFFADTTVEKGKIYYYKVVSVSATGLKGTESTEVMVLP